MGGLREDNIRAVPDLDKKDEHSSLQEGTTDRLLFPSPFGNGDCVRFAINKDCNSNCNCFSGLCSAGKCKIKDGKLCSSDTNCASGSCKRTGFLSFKRCQVDNMLERLVSIIVSLSFGQQEIIVTDKEKL